MDAWIGAEPLPCLNVKRPRVRRPNSRATWRFVTTVFFATSQPVPTYSRPGNPVTSMRPTARAARSQMIA